MFRIVNKQILATHVKRLDVTAPNIARKVLPGQFVSVSPEEGDERIPLSVVDFDRDKGHISLIFQERGLTTKKLGALQLGEEIFSILGPLGKPATIEKVGLVVCIATGVGTAKILPICRAYKRAGNKVIGIIGARTKRALMLEPQIRLSCNKIYITTEDGSYERKGLASDILKQILEEYKPDVVYAIGSEEMMRCTCEMTKIKGIKTFVHLNPIMVDCLGMCASCRVKVGDKIVLACIEGPEFDGHKVDFNEFIKRKKALEEFGECCKHRLTSSQKKNESGIFMRFVSGFLKGQQ